MKREALRTEARLLAYPGHYRKTAGCEAGPVKHWHARMPLHARRIRWSKTRYIRGSVVLPGWDSFVEASIGGSAPQGFIELVWKYARVKLNPKASHSFKYRNTIMFKGMIGPRSRKKRVKVLVRSHDGENALCVEIDDGAVRLKLYYDEESDSMMAVTDVRCGKEYGDKFIEMMHLRDGYTTAKRYIMKHLQAIGIHGAVVLCHSHSKDKDEDKYRFKGQFHFHVVGYGEHRVNSSFLEFDANVRYRTHKENEERSLFETLCYCLEHVGLAYSYDKVALPVDEVHTRPELTEGTPSRLHAYSYFGGCAPTARDGMICVKDVREIAHRCGVAGCDNELHIHEDVTVIKCAGELVAFGDGDGYMVDYKDSYHRGVYLRKIKTARFSRVIYRRIKVGGKYLRAPNGKIAKAVSSDCVSITHYGTRHQYGANEDGSVAEWWLPELRLRMKKAIRLWHSSSTSSGILMLEDMYKLLRIPTDDDELREFRRAVERLWVSDGMETLREDCLRALAARKALRRGCTYHSEAIA